MNVALGLFYAIGALIFYYVRTEVDPKMARKIYGEDYYDNYPIDLDSTKWKLSQLGMSIIWPIGLMFDFILIVLIVITSISQ